MAGTNKILKPNEMLFNFGDKADAMYIVRKGNLKVFFTKGAEEVTLATLNDGAIVGEMAFFDEKPRSASVKAIDTSEVTVISKADFEKLLQQVPKWMVTMMQSLVGRLRQTNERLQALEAAQAKSGGDTGGQSNAGALILGNQTHPFQHALRGMQLLMLSLAKDGEKDNRESYLRRELPTKLWTDFVGESEVLFDKILTVLGKEKLISLKTNPDKVPIILFPNRGTLVNFIEFFGNTAKQLKPLQPFFSEDAIDLFEAMMNQVAGSGYESLNIGLRTLIAGMAAKGKNATNLTKAVSELMILPNFKAQKNGEDLAVKLVLKEHKLVLTYLRYMQHFHEAGLT